MTVDLADSSLKQIFVALMSEKNQFGKGGSSLSYVGVTSVGCQEFTFGNLFFHEIPHHSPLRYKKPAPLSDNQEARLGDIFLQISHTEKHVLWSMLIWRNEKVGIITYLHFILEF